MTYNLVAPENFTADQNQFVRSFEESVKLISSQTNMILGGKDINSRHVISTDAYAKAVGLSRGTEVSGRLDCEMPCEGTAQFADSYVLEDQELLSYGDPGRKKSILNIHEYSNGTKALIFEKYVLKDHSSRAILGTIYGAYEVAASSFFSLIPNYALEFGIGCSIENVNGDLIGGIEKLTEYEYEVCFLLAMNWNFKQISGFMNKHRPSANPRVADTICKCRNRICEKLGLDDLRKPNLRDKLIALGVHRKMPSSFFYRLIGSKSL